MNLHLNTIEGDFSSPQVLKSPQSPDMPLSHWMSGLTIDLKRKDWLLGFLVLSFDLTAGQKIEALFPSDLTLTDQEKNTIKFASFPDGGCQTGDLVYSFTVNPYGENTLNPKRNSDSLYGFVYFRQQSNSQLKRGYLQKSIVLLSQHPFPGLFLRLISLIGFLYFEKYYKKEVEFFREILLQIEEWPRFSPETLNENLLKFFTIHFHLQFNNSRQQDLVPCSLLCEKIILDAPQSLLIEGSQSCLLLSDDLLHFQLMKQLPTFVHNPAGKGMNFCFDPIFQDILTIWELLVLGHSLVLIGQNQTWVSEAIWWLTKLIYPLPYCGDFRPFFTLQDADFPFLLENAPHRSPKKRRPLLLGVTNPFFIEALGEWPNFLFNLEEKQKSAVRPYSPVFSSKLYSSSLPKITTPTKNFSNFTSRSFTNLSPFSPSTPSIKSPVAGKVKNGLHSDYTGLLYKEKPLALPSLPKFFYELTEKLLMPIQRFLMTLIPVPYKLLLEDIQPFPFQFATLKGQYVQLPPDLSFFELLKFSRTNFLKHLKTHGALLSFGKGVKQKRRRNRKRLTSLLSGNYSEPEPELDEGSDQEQLHQPLELPHDMESFYACFINTLHFKQWLSIKQLEIEKEMKKNYLDYLLQLNTEQLSSKKLMPKLTLFLCLQKEVQSILKQKDVQWNLKMLENDKLEHFDDQELFQKLKLNYKELKKEELKLLQSQSLESILNSQNEKQKPPQPRDFFIN